MGMMERVITEDEIESMGLLRMGIIEYLLKKGLIQQVDL